MTGSRRLVHSIESYAPPVFLKVKSLVCLNQCARKRPSYLCSVIKTPRSTPSRSSYTLLAFFPSNSKYSLAAFIEKNHSLCLANVISIFFFFFVIFFFCIPKSFSTNDEHFYYLLVVLSNLQ